jgi:hypothetical protein
MDDRKQTLDGLLRPHRLLNAAFAALIGVMAGHEAEHVAQVVQKNALGRDCPGECRGLLGFIFDLEWVHMAYNASILVALLGLLVAYRLWRPEWRRAAAMCWGCLVAGIAVQGYHVLEHTAKIAQWATNGHVEPTPGILGQLLPPPRGHDFSLIELHFAFNTVVFLLVVAGFFGLHIHRHALPRSAPTLAGRQREDCGAAECLRGLS